MLLAQTAPTRAAAQTTGWVAAVFNPYQDQIVLKGWAADDIIDVAVLSGPGGSTLFSATLTTDPSGFAAVPLPTGTLAPGELVTAQETAPGGTYRELTLIALTIEADAASDTVFGVAPPGASVQTSACGGGTCAGAATTADAVTGTYSVSYAGTIDIGRGSGYTAQVRDADGDSTQAWGRIPDPVIVGSLTWDHIGLLGFAADTGVDVSVGGVTRSVTTNTAGYAFIDPATLGVDLQPGMLVTVTDGATHTLLASYTLESVTIAPVLDVSSGHIDGTAPAGRTVHVAISNPPGPILLSADTIADGAGNWTLNFPIFVVAGATYAEATIDAPGGITAVSTWPPTPPARIVGSLTNDHISLFDFPAATTVDVAVAGIIRTMATDAVGSVFIDPPTLGLDLKAGMTITVSNSSTHAVIATFTLEPVTIDPVLDVSSGHINGTAPAGRTVHVNISNPPGPPLFSANVVSDGAGNWTAPFPVFVVAGATYAQAVVDATGGSTIAETAPPPAAPIEQITTGPQGDVLTLANWPAGAVVAVSVTLGGNPVTFPVSAVTVDGNGFGIANLPAGTFVADEVVTADDGVHTKRRTVLPLIVTADAATEVVSGTGAPPASPVFFYVCAGGACVHADEIADGSGAFAHSFQGAADIEPARASEHRCPTRTGMSCGRRDTSRARRWNRP